MKNVLFCIPSFSLGNGVAKFVMNYYHSLLEKNYKVDFLLVSKEPTNTKYLDEVLKNNSEVYYIPTGNVIGRIKRTKAKMQEILKNKKYDIVDVNLVDLYAYGCISAAKENYVKKIIYHAHNPYTIGKLLFLRDILNHQCIKLSTDLVACTEETGKSIFKKKEFTIIKNAIYFEDYRYDLSARNKYRKELQLEDKLIIGAVGRLTSQKNPFFAIKVFEEILKQEPKAHFIWVSNGDLKDKFLDYITKHNLKENVTLLADRQDINKFYSTFDIFLLPSKYEGLGIVFLEAQCNGLPIYTSDKVPKEVKKCSNVHFLSLTKKPIAWANYILKTYKTAKKRNQYYSILKNSDYDYNVNKDNIIQLYKGNRS